MNGTRKTTGIDWVSVPALGWLWPCLLFCADGSSHLWDEPCTASQRAAMWAPLPSPHPSPNPSLRPLTRRACLTARMMLCCA